MPLILTSSMEDQAQGPLFEELQKAVPKAYANRVLRGGVVYPAMTAVKEGYSV